MVGEQPCLNLGRSVLQNWQGLLFEGPRDVARRYVSQAADTLADLPDGPAVAALRDLGDRLVDSVPA